MPNNIVSLSFATFFWIISANYIAKADQQAICADDFLEASYELENSWIYICNQNQEKSFIKVDKQAQKELINVPAFGTFPTYAAIEGELEDPNSKIYNVSPFDFKIIQASIIKKIDPVKETTYQQTGTKVNILTGEKEQEALTVCQEKKPVQVFETKQDDIYICIDSSDQDLNSINLSYIQKSKNDSYPLIKLPANFLSSLSYETQETQGKKYSISHQGLSVSESATDTKVELVTDVYIASPDTGKIQTHSEPTNP